MSSKKSKEFKEYLNSLAKEAGRIPTWVFAKMGVIQYKRKPKWRESTYGRDYKGIKKHD